MFCSREFVAVVGQRVLIPNEDACSIEGRGQQAVIVGSKGGSLFKVFAKTAKTVRSPAHLRESTALSAIGGFEGQFIRTPTMMNYKDFGEVPFEVGGKSFDAAIELSRLHGVKPNPVTRYQYGDIGNALAELHQHMERRKDALHSLSDNIVWRRMDILREKSNVGHVVPPKLRKKLMAESSKLAIDCATRFVHGDFHMGNVVFDGEKYGIFDLAGVGLSVPEQDMTALATQDSQNLRAMFNAYAKVTGYKPQKGKLMTLHCLDLAIATEQAHMSFQPERSSLYLEMLHARMS